MLMCASLCTFVENSAAARNLLLPIAQCLTMNKKILIGASVLALAAIGGFAWYASKKDGTDVQYKTAKIERGSLLATVSASGSVTPVTQVIVGTQVSGQIKEIYVDFNSEVKAGQLIALIDPETLEYRVRQAQADLDAARATVLTAQANILTANAGISRANVDLQEAQRDYERKKSLVAQQFITASEADKARALVNTLGEALKAANAQRAVTDAQAKSAQASVSQREAQLAQANIDISRTRITSPVDGVVIKRSVEKGQTVAASLQSPELFIIAQNLRDMQVEASIDEADIGRVKANQAATFTVDAFAGRTFEGEIRQLRKAAQNVQNVVTYTAVVGFSNSDGRLLPGMTANVRIVTDKRDSVLKVPNAALRVRVAGVEPEAAASAPAGAPAPASSAASQSSWNWLLGNAFAQAPPGGGGGLAAMRERLVSELQLTLEQQQKLDAISAELRPKFMAMRDMPEAERGAARAAVMGEMREKINAMLTPEQRGKYAQLQAQTQAARPAPAAAAAPVATSSMPNNDKVKNAVVSAQQAIPATNSVSNAVSTAAKPAAAPPPSTAAPTAAAPPPAGGAGGPGGPGGQGAALRARMVSELALTAEQQAKFDVIYTEARPKFAELRTLPEDQRAKARDRVMADIRARIGDMLTPEQKVKYQQIVAENASGQASRGRIYLLVDGKPRAFNVRLGITDGSSTELMVSPRTPGALVITGTGAAGAGAAPRAGATTGPRLPF
jgi:HlyD family secretion protein